MNEVIDGNLPIQCSRINGDVVSRVAIVPFRADIVWIRCKTYLKLVEAILQPRQSSRSLFDGHSKISTFYDWLSVHLVE